MTQILCYQGLPEDDDEEFCDHWDVDLDVECNDDELWAIEEDDHRTLVGFVCANHKAAYEKSLLS